MTKLRCMPASRSLSRQSRASTNNREQHVNRFAMSSGPPPRPTPPKRSAPGISDDSPSKRSPSSTNKMLVASLGWQSGKQTSGRPWTSRTRQ
eukprot:4689693-Prymnesium_polylepis.1